MCAYRKAILTIGMQLHAMSLPIIWSICFHSANKQMPVGIDFIFTSERAIYSSFMKISVPSLVFRGKTLRMKVKLCKVYTLKCQQGDEICFRNNKIRKFDTLERQMMGVE